MESQQTRAENLQGAIVREQKRKSDAELKKNQFSDLIFCSNVDFWQYFRPKPEISFQIHYKFKLFFYPKLFQKFKILI